MFKVYFSNPECPAIKKYFECYLLFTAKLKTQGNFLIP